MFIPVGLRVDLDSLSDETLLEMLVSTEAQIKKLQRMLDEKSSDTPKDVLEIWIMTYKKAGAVLKEKFDEKLFPD